VKPIAYLLIAILYTRAAAEAGPDTSVALLQPVSNVYTGIDVPCDPDKICMDTWFRWDFEVISLLHGPKLPKHLRAAMLTHVQARIYRPLQLLVVLEPIADAARRKQLGADYSIKTLSFPHTLYCLDEKPMEYGLSIPDESLTPAPHDTRYCFDIRELTR
jgi:hypothetical protein